MEQRLSVRKPINCRIEGVSGTEKFVAEGFDISDHGVSFKTEHRLPLDSEAILHYRLDDDGPMISAHVRIIREGGGRYGATFLDRKQPTA